MILQDRLDALKADFEGGKFPLIPSAADLETMARATAGLIAGGQAQRAIKAGDRAPDFVLNDPDGRPVASRDLLAIGPLVVRSIAVSGARIAIWICRRWKPYCPKSASVAPALSRSRRRPSATAGNHSAITG